MPRTKTVADLEAELQALTRDKAHYLSESRGAAKVLQDELNTIIGQQKAKAKLDAMSVEEKAAMADALGAN